MKKYSWLFKPQFYILLSFYIVLSYLTLGLDRTLARFFFTEDGFFEYVGALSLFAASAVMFIVFARAYRTRATTGIHWIKIIVYLGIAVLFFFGAGEEISWGQRIFHIETPEALEEVNEQQELNVHNLVFFDYYLMDSDDLFNIFWMTVVVLIPALALVSKRFKNWAENLIPIAPWQLSLLFLLNYLTAKVAKILYLSVYSFFTVSFSQAVQEVKESHYELLFFLLALYILWDFNQTLNNAPPSTV
ncbi:MAG: hypothetical protein KF758_11740 [Anaerolineales bacterium]|nr:hypothetical protein [Anaerolineales bacterium]MBX3037572.1 hypothetical protein [Anaerolineales bacterium]